MDVVTTQLERLFGQSHNGQITELLVKQSDIAARCATLMRTSNCTALKEIIALEREADATEERIHEIIDSAFVLRFDKSDVGSLASGLDNILDGMRQIAMHVDVYKPYLPELRPEAKTLLEIVERMTTTLRQLLPLLHERRVRLERVKEFTRELKRAEAEADALLHKAEATLVREHQSSDDPLTFSAHDKLSRMLEHVTDVANYCGSLILSIARKEA